MEQRLLLGWAQNQIVMVVTDRQVDRSIVSPCDLGHPDRFEIVILGPFYIRCPQRDISELKYLRFEFLLHSLLSFVLSHSLAPLVRRPAAAVRREPRRRVRRCRHVRETLAASSPPLRPRACRWQRRRPATGS